MFLLCGHAAKQPSDRALVQAALDMLAARLSYPSRASLMICHMQTLVFDWCSNGYNLHHFLAIQVSLSHTHQCCRVNRVPVAVSSTGFVSI